MATGRRWRVLAIFMHKGSSTYLYFIHVYIYIYMSYQYQ